MKNSINFLGILYVSFCLFAVYHIIAQQFGEASMNLGIALAFDPFDVNQTWKDRPIWQKTWLILHLAICSACLGFEMGIGDVFKK